MPPQTASKITIAWLPLELRSTILSSLPDLHSLVSAAQSCQAFYLAFKQDEERIIKEVVISYISPEVLPEADITQRCSPPYLSNRFAGQNQLSEEQSAELIDFTSKFLNQLERPKLSLMKWSMRDALALADFHSVVVHFTEKFMKECSQTTYTQLGNSLHSRPPTRTEKARIARTMYRFELFRKLFGCLKDQDSSTCVPMFLAVFTPWEHAQLGCVHDFLAREVIPAFNGVAKHDIVWAECQVNFDCDMTSPYIQHLLSLGLKEIRKIETAKSYMDRERALCIRDLPPEMRYNFLLSALKDMNAIDDEELENNKRERIDQRLSFLNDGDAGPEEIMKLSQQHAPVAIYEEMNWPYRQWGYVMWDSIRLHTLGVFESPWKPAADFQENPAFVSMSDMQKSWNARVEIYERGGRGWWDKNDDTRVVWPWKKEAEEPSAYIPTSLGDAKRFLLSSF